MRGLRIAADLRRRISSGEWGPGGQLPTLPALCEEYGVSDTTIRNAMRLLANEGLVETKARAGTRVRSRPAVHHMAADRYRTAAGAPATPYTQDQGIGWSEYRLDKRFEKTEATPELAALFECEPGERLLARHFVFHDNDQPTQMSTSYVRWSDVAGTPVALTW
ncbi:GntR family transcriptional regulator [Streptomyces sp. SID3212]|uniref:GntR family transcriptional regulator n=1 Tax=Streptomyces sp. SID3212 TaxID=2690259 RepID=UPI001F2F8E14|nr:GntR family transcriptional regulator [Streptomyces sp. SID3212]